MFLPIILVACGGFFGAIARFGVSNFVKKKYSTVFPAATLFVNLLGSFLLGLIIGNNLGESWRYLLGTGFMGAFTTFSTFNLENIQLLQKRNWKIPLLYITISYTFGILLAFLGFRLGMAA
ncbi:MAG: fluoride efflux transporter CrcB [Bacillota bacterium]|nr:fluoride efflux transporter CrcB [Bacillota bacterium]